MLDVDSLTRLADRHLTDADEALRRDYPGMRSGRQPVHTVYVPADRFHGRLAGEYGAAALALLDRHEESFRGITGADDAMVERGRHKLTVEPVEDLRVDFEDGYGVRSDEEEDDHAAQAVAGFWSSIADEPGLPAFGIRFKSLEQPTRERGIRTLALVVDGLEDLFHISHHFVVTLPKVTSVDQVEALVLVLEALESRMSGVRGELRFEIQVETPQSVLGADGTALVARMIHAALGRCTGLHYGTYDYSAFCGIAAGDQSLEHPAADHAKAIMQAAAAGTGVRLSDGSTNILPVGDQLRSGWELHHRLVTRALHRGFYQGWDLHPAQLPTRYAATFAFYRDGFDAAAARLSDYAAARTGAVADEPATARALADFVLRGRDCGAVSADEVAGAGLDEDALAGLARRSAQGAG